MNPNEISKAAKQSRLDWHEHQHNAAWFCALTEAERDSIITNARKTTT